MICVCFSDPYELSDVGDVDPDPFDEDFCYDDEYRRRTLKLIKETPFIGLFKDLKVTMMSLFLFCNFISLSSRCTALW